MIIEASHSFDLMVGPQSRGRQAGNRFGAARGLTIVARYGRGLCLYAPEVHLIASNEPQEYGRCTYNFADGL
jgi:hypothetical protein